MPVIIRYCLFWFNYGYSRDTLPTINALKAFT